MFRYPSSPSRDDLAGLLYATSSFWPPPWLNLVLAAIGLIALYYKHHIHIIHVLNLSTTSSHYNTQEKLKTNKKNNKKNVSMKRMPDGYGPVSSLMSTKKKSQSFVIGALIAAFLVYAVLPGLSFKAQHFGAAVVEVGNTPPSSLPLDLPPPQIDIFREVALMEASSEYEDINSSFSPHTPKALASFLKDKAISLLFEATVQTYFGPVYTSTTQEGEEVFDDIDRFRTPEGVSISGSDDLLPSLKSGFQLVGLKGYGQLTFDTDSPSVCFESGLIAESIINVQLPKSQHDDDKGAEEDDSNDCRGDIDIEVDSLMKVDTKVGSSKTAVLPWLLVLLVILPYFGSLDPSSSLKTNQKGKYGYYKMKRYGHDLHSKILASLFFLGCIATALDTDGSEVGMQATKKTPSGDNTEPIHRMKQLNSRLRRGNMSPESVVDEAPDMMLELNDITTSQLAVMDKMLQSYESGDKETFIGLLKLTLGNFDGMKLLSQEATKTSPELALPDDIMNLSLEDIIPEGFDLEDIPADMLADMFDYDRFAAMAEHLRELHLTNEDTAVTLHKVRRILREEKGDEFERPQTSDFNFHDSDSTFNNNFQFKFQTKHGFNPHGFKNMKKMIRQVRNRQGFKTPRHLKTKFMGRKGTSTRREQRMRHLEQDKDCQPHCPNDNRTCVCNRLRSCVNQLESYDFAVLFAGEGFVGVDGKFNIDAEDIQLFDVDGKLTAKIDRMRALAASNTDEDCSDLLEQLHSACPPGSSCSSANHQTSQLTVDQVCDAINTDTFLLMEEIGKAYEDHSLIQGGPFLAGGTVDMEVLKWYESQVASQEPGESSCGSIDGEVIGTNCRLDWLNWNGQRGDDFVHFQCKTSCRNIMDAKLQVVESEWIDDLQSGTCLHDESKSCVVDSDCLIRKCIGYESTICSSSSDCPVVTPATFGRCIGSERTRCTKDSDCDGIFPYICSPGTDEVRAECGEQLPTTCDVDLSRCASISSEVCGEFVSEFDRMYQASPNGPQENPMRQYPDGPIYPAIGLEALTRAQFPVDYELDATNHGITQQVGYENADLYDYADRFPFPGIVAPSRGAWTLKQDEIWLRCVRYNGQNCNNPNKVPSLVSNDEVHPIVCCSDTEHNDSWAKAPSTSSPSPPSWCPYRLRLENSLIPEADRCKSGTFDEAVEYCGRYGGRLCSSEEFVNNCAAGSGCAWSQSDNRGEVAWSAYTYEYSANTGCVSSLNDPVLFQNALQACDDSMAILVGSTTSVGTVARLASIVNDPNVENAFKRLPGYCCMDTALDSEHFGFNYDSENESMECQNTSLYHLGVNSEPCENAGGRWYPKPCHTLKGCIDDRPPVDPGYCVEDATIQCTEPTPCPINLGIGTCISQEAGNPSAGTCTSDQTCPSGSVCKFDDQVQTECWYRPGSFEEWAASFAIDDPSDQVQCEDARSELGFDPYDRDDALICEQFDAYKCEPDSFFDDIDDINDDIDDPTAPITISVTPTQFTPILIEGEPLAFDNLENTPSISKVDKDTQSSIKTALDALKVSKAYYGFAKDINKDLYEKGWKFQELTCAPFSDQCSLTLGPGPAYCLAAGICYLVLLAAIVVGSFVNYTGMVAYHLTNIAVEGLTIEKTGYDKALYYDSFYRYDWVVESLGKINTNIGRQHQGMIEQLSRQHETVTNYLGNYTSCATDHAMFELASAIAEANGAINESEPLSSECRKLLGVDRRRRLSEGGDDDGLYHISLSFPSDHKTKSDIYNEVDDVEEIMNDVHDDVHDMDKKLNNIMLVMNAILQELDMNPAVPDPMNDSKSKKSKKAKQAKPEAPDESDESDLFTRNLLGVKESVNVKFDDMKNQGKLVESKVESVESKVQSIEGKVELIESKVGSMEGKIESIEGKVESIQKTMEELKDMLSQLTMRGADVA